MTPDEVRDIFEGHLQSKRDLELMRSRVEALRSPTLSAGTAQVSGGGTSDPTATAGSALVDEAAQLERLEAAYRRSLERVAALIQGAREALGLAYGNVLEDRYVRGYEWSVVASLGNVSRKTAYRYRDVAFDWIASVGEYRAKEGAWGILRAQE